MILKSIYFNNYKCFKDRLFHLGKINLICGNNGVGKSTLAIDAPLFVYHGHSDKNLSELSNRYSDKTPYSVTIVDDKHTITRKYPTEIEILKDNKQLEFANSQEAQNYLNSEVKDLDYFRKMRMIDVKKGINILEEGNVGLRKNLLAFNEKTLNLVRSNLQEKKRIREIYNKDNITTFPFYPSETRLNILKNKLLDIYKQIDIYEKELSQLNTEYIQFINRKGKIENQKEYYTSQKNKILENSQCPHCRRKVSKDLKLELIKDIGENIKSANEVLETILEMVKNQEDILLYFKKLKSKIEIKKEKITEFKFKLEEKLKQKNFKYTARDILIMKQSILELDKIMNRCIINWVKGLEPIINSIVNRIGFNLEFSLNEKGQLELKMYKDGKEFSYRELSTGQKLILSIAFQLALLIEEGEEGVIIADEGFSGLDQNNLNMVFELFRELPFQLISIVHRYEIDKTNNINVINLND